MSEINAYTSLTGPMRPDIWGVWRDSTGYSAVDAAYRHGPQISKAERDKAVKEIQIIWDYGQRARAQLSKDIFARYKVKNTKDLSKIWPSYNNGVEVRVGTPGQPGALLVESENGTFFPIALIGLEGVTWLSEPAAIATIKGKPTSSDVAQQVAEQTGAAPLETPDDILRDIRGGVWGASNWQYFIMWIKTRGITFGGFTVAAIATIVGIIELYKRLK